METLEAAKREIARARSSVSDTEVRTKLESITASLQEMLDAEEGEQTDADVAFGDTDFAGTAPDDDNLEELGDNLLELAENVDQQDVQEHLQAAQQQLLEYRSGRDEAGNR